MDSEPCLAVDGDFHGDVLSVLLAPDVENVLAWPIRRRVQKTALKNANLQMELNKNEWAHRKTSWFLPGIYACHEHTLQPLLPFLKPGFENEYRVSYPS